LSTVKGGCASNTIVLPTYLLAVGRGRDIRTEWTFLLDVPDDLMIRHRDDNGFRIERRTDIAVFSVRREDLHAGSAGNLDPGLLLIGFAIEHGDVILAADGDPDLVAVGREESFMRRAADIGCVLHRIGCGVDERHGV
jgi:hypothetical protein